MKNLFLLLLALIALVSFTQTTSSQTQEEMKKWMDYMTPGDAHKSMAHCVGTWKSKITMWMDPKAEPTKSEGSATFEMILGGRYLQGKHSGNMMGMPFEGFSLDGFDNTTKQFTSVWVDNMGTGTMVLKGTYDEATKTTTYTGECVDPMTGGNMKIKQTITFTSDNAMVMEMFGPDKSGNEFKMMRLEASR